MNIKRFKIKIKKNLPALYTPRNRREINELVEIIKIIIKKTIN